MSLRHLRSLRGPNPWAPCPVIEATLDLASAESADHTRQTLGRLGDLLGPANGTADLATAFGKVALRLQDRAGMPVSFCATRPGTRAGEVRVAFQYTEEPVGRGAAESAWRLLQAAADGKPLAVEEEQRRICDLEYQQRLPASTAVIANAAKARGIPAVLLSPEYGRYLRLGHGAKQHRCLSSEPDFIGAVGRTASTDKYLAKQLMRAAGVPVPVGKLVGTAEDAWAAAQELGLPVATKPLDSDLATGVSLDLRSREQVEAGFRAAIEHSTWVMLERFAPGLEHRVLVVADKIAAVTQIAPPQVRGDGTATVAELVERVNSDPRRGKGEKDPLSLLKIDDVALAVLAGQGHSLTSVPKAGERVLVRRNPPYFKNGGNLVDLTDQIHPSIAGHAVAAAQALQLRVAGLDVVALDISRPLEEQGGVVVEINAGPGLWLHMAPWADSPRPIGDAIVASMFPPGDDGRVPVVALVGDVGDAAKHLTTLLTRAGLCVGVVGPAEFTVNGRRWPASGTPQERASQLMQFPAVEVALLETTAEELVGSGFGNDRCAVAVVAAESNSDEVRAAVRHALGPKGVCVIAARDGSIRVEPEDRSLRLENGTVLMRGESVPLGPMPKATAGAGLPAALAAGLSLGQEVDALRAYLASENAPV